MLYDFFDNNLEKTDECFKFLENNFIKKSFKINIPGLSNFILCQKRA